MNIFLFLLFQLKIKGNVDVNEPKEAINTEETHNKQPEPKYDINIAKKFLFHDLDINNTIDILSKIDTAESHSLQYFVLKNFTNTPVDECLCHLIASSDTDNKELFSLMYTYNAYFSINLPTDIENTADIYYDLATKIYERYKINKFLFKSKRLFKEIDNERKMEETVETVLNLILAGDKRAEAFFISAIESGRIKPHIYENILENMAESGNQKAMGILGEMYLEGRGVEKCVDTAMHYFTEGSRKKDALCFTGMGIIYLKEKNDLTLAKRYFEEGSMRGNAEADFYLYILYKEKFNLEDFGVGSLISSANKGHLPALYLYASKLYKQNNKKQAVLYLSALCDYSEAILNGIKEAENLYIENRWEESLMKLIFCAEMGSTNAMYNILYILEKKRFHLKKNQEIKLFEKNLVAELIFRYNKSLTDMGYKTNLVELGNCYYYGTGCEQSYSDAYSFYLASSLFKDPHGFYSLAYLYEHGLGVGKNLKISLKHIIRVGQLNSKAYLLVWYVSIKIVMKMGIDIVFSRNVLLFALVVGIVTVFSFWKRKTPVREKSE